MHSLTPSPSPLHFALPPTPLYPFFPSSPTPCIPFYTTQPRRRALRVYLVPFSDLFFAKSKIYSRQPKMYPREQIYRLAYTAKPRRRALRVYLVKNSSRSKVRFTRLKLSAFPPCAIINSASSSLCSSSKGYLLGGKALVYTS